MNVGVFWSVEPEVLGEARVGVIAGGAVVSRRTVRAGDVVLGLPATSVSTIVMLFSPDVSGTVVVIESGPRQPTRGIDRDRRRRGIA